jgi:hypothetical protein
MHIYISAKTTNSTSINIDMSGYNGNNRMIKMICLRVQAIVILIIIMMTRGDNST